MHHSPAREVEEAVEDKGREKNMSWARERKRRKNKVKTEKDDGN